MNKEVQVFTGLHISSQIISRFVEILINGSESCLAGRQDSLSDHKVQG